MGLGFPSVGDVLNTIVNAIAKLIWGFADAVLRDAFVIIDAHSRPSLVYSPGGPLGVVYPITLWVGLVVAFGLALAQAGRIALSGGQGIGAAAKGLGLYALITAAGLTVINALSTAADVTATGIIKAGFNVDSFAGLAGDSTFMAGAVKGLTGWALGAMSLIEVIPFGFGLIVEVLIRQGALLVLAATYPIICAGLVHEKFARWYWTGLRWIIALIMMTPLIAIALVIGHSIAQSVSTGRGGSALDALGQALVSGTICLLSLTAPLVLFKMFAFIDPNSASGQTARGWFGGGAAAATGGAGTADAESSQAGGSAPGDGAGAGDPFGDDPAPAGQPGGGSSGGGAGQLGGSSSPGSSQGVMAQVMSALSPAQAMSQSSGGANGAAAHATDSLDAVGAGHRGGPTAGGGRDGGSQQQGDGQGDSPGSGPDEGLGSDDPQQPGSGGGGLDGSAGTPGQQVEALQGSSAGGQMLGQLPAAAPSVNLSKGPGGEGPFEGDPPIRPAGGNGGTPGPGGGPGGAAGGAAEGGAAAAAI